MSDKVNGRKKLKRTDWNAIVAAVISTIIALAVMATAGLWGDGWGELVLWFFTFICLTADLNIGTALGNAVRRAANRD